MNFPPKTPSSTASGSDNHSTARSGRPQPSVWGRPSSQVGTRQGLAPIATSDLNSCATFGARKPGTSNSPGPYSSTTSPLASTFSAVLSSSNRLSGSRHLSSTSSTGSPLTLFQAGAQQPTSFPPGQSVTSPRSRTVTPLSQLVSAASTQSGAQAGGGAAGFSSAGGGASRSGTYSPSLSGTNIGSPTAFSFDRSGTLPSGASSASGGQSSLSKISVAQVLLLLDSISEKEGRAKWESKADQIRKVSLVWALQITRQSLTRFKLVDSNGMDVFPKFFRRLVSGNASKVFPGANIKASENAGAGSYQILVEEMQKVLKDTSQAQKIAESIDEGDGDIFRDFDLIPFVEHFDVGPVAETALCIAFRTCTKTDLHNKGW